MDQRKQYDIMHGVGQQDDWVYGDEVSDEHSAVPMDADRAAEMLVELDKRIKRLIETAAFLEGSAAASREGLMTEIHSLRRKRRDLRSELTKLTRVSMRRGGLRARARKRTYSVSFASVRLEHAPRSAPDIPCLFKSHVLRQPGSEWWDVPDDPDHDRVPGARKVLTRRIRHVRGGSHRAAN